MGSEENNRPPSRGLLKYFDGNTNRGRANVS